MNREVCMVCWMEWYGDYGELALRSFEEAWGKGSVYCRPNLVMGAIIPVNSEPPPECRFLLEQTIAEASDAKT
jgi:hypothetical protein